MLRDGKDLQQGTQWKDCDSGMNIRKSHFHKSGLVECSFNLFLRPVSFQPSSYLKILILLAKIGFCDRNPPEKPYSLLIHPSLSPFFLLDQVDQTTVAETVQ